MTKKAEAQIQTAMRVYREALAAGVPARTVDFVRAFTNAAVNAKYMEPARRLLGVRSWEAEDGFIWVAPPVNGFRPEHQQMGEHLSGEAVTVLTLIAKHCYNIGEIKKALPWIKPERVERALRELESEHFVGQADGRYFTDLSNGSMGFRFQL